MSTETSSEVQNDLLAQAAVEPVTNSMMVGLGTGRAASRGIHALAEKVKAESLDITCVATSHRSAELAESLGLIVRPMREVDHVDYLFDGVDELDPTLAMLKGAGGAMTREKIVAESADQCVFLMDESKLVTRLGERMPLPVEVLDFGLKATERRLRKLGLEPKQRSVDDDPQQPYLTDEGNPVLDCDFGRAQELEISTLSAYLDWTPGVVGHGLFVTQADMVLIESADRSHLTRRVRENR